jgi:hypothetical protein
MEDVNTGKKPDDLAAFSAAITLMTMEAQLIWRRYNTMLGANALISAVLGHVGSRGSITKQELFFLLAGSLFGLALTVLWWRMTSKAWDLYHRWASDARQYKSTSNPMESYYDWCKETGRQPPKHDQIRGCAEGVILLFLSAYVLASIIILALLLCPLTLQST